MRRIAKIISTLITASLLLACSKSIEDQMQEYMRFYYPTTGQYSYEIIFDWGKYQISTGPGINDSLHPDSEPYRNYITLRPMITGTAPRTPLPAYLITPEGMVWSIENTDDIPAIKHREGISSEDEGASAAIVSTTINSYSEPLIDHFRVSPAAWTFYMALK